MMDNIFFPLSSLGPSLESDFDKGNDQPLIFLRSVHSFPRHIISCIKSLDRWLEEKYWWANDLIPGMMKEVGREWRSHFSSTCKPPRRDERIDLHAWRLNVREWSGGHQWVKVSERLPGPVFSSFHRPGPFLSQRFFHDEVTWRVTAGDGPFFLFHICFLVTSRWLVSYSFIEAPERNGMSLASASNSFFIFICLVTPKQKIRERNSHQTLKIEEWRRVMGRLLTVSPGPFFLSFISSARSSKFPNPSIKWTGQRKGMRERKARGKRSVTFP